MSIERTLFIVLILSLLTLVSCIVGQRDLVENNLPAQADVLLAAPPPDSIDVRQARAIRDDVEQVTIVGRVGGMANPFVEGRAAFTIVDRGLDPCPPEEGCPSPWDYCCDPAATRANSALVMMVDESDRPIQQDARTLLGLQPLATVFAQGTLRSDEQGNLVIRARRVFIE